MIGRTWMIAFVAWTLLVWPGGPPLRAADWPMLGCDPQRSNYTPEPVGSYVNYPNWKHAWTWNTPASIPWRSQVVAAGGIVSVGTYDGILHGIDIETGTTRWRFQTGGPILHSPAIVAGRVYTGSHDGAVYCVDANSGAKVWSYQTGGGIVASPLVVGGVVYIGSKDGFFYALDAAGGAMRWRVDVGEPVVVSAACSDAARLVFSGTSHVNAFAVTLDGRLAWKRQLLGQSLQEAWPQVSERHGVVIYRALPVYDMWNLINHAGNGHPNDKQAYLQGIFKAPPKDIDEEQDGISDYLARHPFRQTFFALDVKTGQDKYARPVPVLWSWGISATMHAQVIDNEGDRAFAMWRTLATPGARCEMPELGFLDLGRGRFVERKAFRVSNGHFQNGLWGGDEPWPITGCADAIFMTQNHGPTGWSLLNYQSFIVLGPDIWTVWRWQRDPERAESRTHWAPQWCRNVVGCTYTNGKILWQGGGGIGCRVKP